MKTILIPTDFSSRSLSVVKTAMTSVKDEEAKLLLVHGIYLPDSISELLFFSKSRLINSLETEDFVSSCWLIRNHFQSKIKSLHLDIFTGLTMAAFKEYLEVNQVDEAFIPKNQTFSRRHQRSFDVVPYIRKSDLIFTEVVGEEMVERESQEVDQLEMLFFNS